jgi:uncharacterized protein YoaH (UPF0181 family)
VKNKEMERNIYKLVELILELWQNGMSLQEAIKKVKEENHEVNSGFREKVKV